MRVSKMNFSKLKGNLPAKSISEVMFSNFLPQEKRENIKKVLLEKTASDMELNNLVEKSFSIVQQDNYTNGIGGCPEFDSWPPGSSR